MATTTHYKSNGFFITQQQTVSNSDFQKITLLDGNLWTIEETIVLSTSTINEIRVVLKENDVKENVVSSLKGVYNKFLILSIESTFSDFDIYTFEEYNSGGLLLSVGKVTYDKNNREIFFTCIEQTTNKLKYATKRYYSPISNEGDEIFSFYYDEVGDLTHVADHDNLFDNDQYFTLNDFLESEEVQSFFPWASHPYYHSAYPFLPTCNL